jgi:E3 ubiquitin-protein ligase HERC4
LALYKKLLKKSKIDLDDMKTLSPTIYQSLKSVLNYQEDDLESALCFTFIIEREVYGETRQIELKPDGSSIMVNQKNKQEFVDLYVDYIFNKSCEKQFQAFSAGFRRVINSKPLELFYPDELMSFVVNIKLYFFKIISYFVDLRLGIRRMIGMNFKRKLNIKENIILIILSCKINRKKTLLFF